MKLKLCSFLLIVSILSLNFNAQAFEQKDQDELEYRTMEEMAGAIRLEKKQIESMVDKMVNSGRISVDEGSKAKREIASLKDSDLEELKTKAIAEVKSKRLLDP